MQPFKYSRVTDVPSGTQILKRSDSARFLAGGTNLLDLMKENVVSPTELADINGIDLPDLRTIKETPGGLSLGALVVNSETANHPYIRQHFPLLSQAILSGASAQIRNMATTGGNLNQRTRCSYFYEVSMPCNKREPGTGCGALEGINKMHAIFGWTKDCVAVHPSDMCVALAALDAVIRIQDADGKQRSIAFADYHKLPDNTPEKDNSLNHGEMVIAVEIPQNNFAAHSSYLKIRDRASYAFALVSVAAGIELQGRLIKNISIAMGGVAHKPWRLFKAEKFLKGKEASDANLRKAAEVEMRDAKTLKHNNFKVSLGNAVIVRALQEAREGERKL